MGTVFVLVSFAVFVCGFDFVMGTLFVLVTSADLVFLSDLVLGSDFVIGRVRVGVGGGVRSLVRVFVTI